MKKSFLVLITVLIAVACVLTIKIKHQTALALADNELPSKTCNSTLISSPQSNFK